LIQAFDPAIGDGLRATREFLTSRVATRLPGLERYLGDDSAVVPWHAESVVCASDTFIVQPAVFPGGDLGTLAVAGVTNDLLCSGARPAVLMLNIIAGPRATDDLVDRVLESVARTSRSVGARIVGGDTKYLPEQPHLDLAVAAFGVGSLHWRKQPFNLRDARNDDVLICTGTLANHSIAVLSAREGLGFERVITSDCAPLVELVGAAAQAGQEDLVAIRDLTRGGLGGALCDLAELCRCDVDVDTAEIPVDRHVRAACEMLGLDPLFLANEGKLLLVVRPRVADAVLAAVRDTEQGSKAAVIGSIADPAAGVGIVRLRAGPEGPTRTLVEPTGLAVPRLC
jgi:hydrogenase expression/formation protein HypE